MGERRKCAGEARSPGGPWSFWRDAHSADPTAEAKAPAVPDRGPSERQWPARRRPLARDTSGNTAALGRAEEKHTGPPWRRPSCGGGHADTARGSGRKGPSCGAPVGPAESRFRPETPATPSADALFFNRGPNLLDPLPNSVFVPLDGFACGFLRAPVHGVQQSTNVIHAIAHTEAALDVLGDPRTGPQIGGESRRLRPAQQLLLQLLALLRRQFRRSSAGWNGSESSFASAALGTLPTADAARVNLEDAGDFSLRQALLEQIDGALTFALQLFRTALRSDRSPPHHQSSIGHYLCRNQ